MHWLDFSEQVTCTGILTLRQGFHHFDWPSKHRSDEHKIIPKNTKLYSCWPSKHRSDEHKIIPKNTKLYSGVVVYALVATYLKNIKRTSCRGSGQHQPGWSGMQQPNATCAYAGLTRTLCYVIVSLRQELLHALMWLALSAGHDRVPRTSTTTHYSYLHMCLTLWVYTLNTHLQHPVLVPLHVRSQGAVPPEGSRAQPLHFSP